MVRRYIRKNSLSYFLLLALEKAVDGYVGFEDFTYHAYRQYDIRDLKTSEFGQALKRLREKGYIEEDKVDANKVILKLTELGKEVLGVEFDESKWDGVWRVVIFDIPEQKRIIRDMFRRRLKHWGFSNWQQSVWVTKQPVTNKLRNTIKELGIDKWVAVLESSNISPDNILFNGR